MHVLYTIGFLLLGLALLPRLLWRCLRGATYHRDLRQRFGYVSLPAAVTRAPQGCLWFHAASVGEIQGLQPIIAALHTACPEFPVLVSTFTSTGKTMAQRLLPEAAAIFLLPLDVPWIMQRLVQQLRCRAFIVQETELWPNLFQAMAHHHVPIIVVNGRLSCACHATLCLVPSLGTPYASTRHLIPGAIARDGATFLSAWGGPTTSPGGWAIPISTGSSLPPPNLSRHRHSRP